ncbi:MAG: tail fiber domain-containing protein [Bacteroidetes bacterium]|nr:tail fiber domain-containing protein [Bacteroidota bacterium]
MIGTDAGTRNASGNYNTILGYRAGEKTTSNYGTMVGYLAGNQTTTGFSQTMFGYMAGANNTGNYNTFIGVEAGAFSGSGGDNTYIGLAAGDYAQGSGNVFLGQFAGYNESGSNKLIISTGYTGADNLNNALIYGDFSAKQLKFNGNLGVNANPGTISLYALDTKVSNDDPAILGQHNISANYGVGVHGIGGWFGVIGEALNTGGIGFRAGVYGNASGGATNYGVYGSAPIGASSYAGYFNGNVYATGTVAWSSDKSLKKNISPLSGSLQKVLGLQGVTYEWKSETELSSVMSSKSNGGKETDNKTLNFPTGLQIGVIAQDVEKVLPELVHTDGEGLKSVDYTKIIPLLIEAIKDQQKQIDELKSQVNSLAGQVKK